MKLNPNGVLPTLIDHDLPIFESTSILEYLEDKYLEDKYIETNFRLFSVFLRSQMRAFLVFVDVWPTPVVRTPSFQFGGLLRKFAAMSDENFKRLVEKRPLKADFYNSFDKNRGFSDKKIFSTFEAILKTAKRMDEMLQKFGGPWLLGEEYSLADMAVLPLIDRMQDLGLDGLWLNTYPSISDWLFRAQRRPATLKSYVDGSRLSEQFPELVGGAGTLSDFTDAYFKTKSV